MTTLEPAGESCPGGGTALSVGLDVDGDGQLSEDEIDSTTYLCDEETSSGAPGLVSTADEPPGENCANGGVAVATGRDLDGDGELGEDEVEDTSYICVPDAPESAAALTAVATEGPGENCPFGGTALSAGLDTNANGALDADEVTSVSYICAEESSEEGASLTAVLEEAAGENCANGGVAIATGVDADGDGLLGDAEVTSVAYVCVPDDGPAAVPLVTVEDEPAGENCINGGVAIASGADADSDGVLSAEETTTRAFVCSPERMIEAPQLTRVTDLDPGAECANGGVEIASGRDVDGDGELSASEVVAVSYICSPADGVDALTSVTDEPPGESCANGGLRFDVGPDTDGDGVLSSEEVTETAYSCFPGIEIPAVLSDDEYLGAADEGCPGGYVRTGIGLDEDANGELDESERTIIVTSCNALPQFPTTEYFVRDCESDAAISIEAMDPDGELASFAMSVRASGASSELVLSDDGSVLIPAGEHRGGAYLDVTAFDQHGASSQQLIRVIFSGAGCEPVRSFYGIDPEQCIEVSGTLAGRRAGPLVLGRDGVYYSGHLRTVRAARDLQTVEVIVDQRVNTLFSDSASNSLFSLWSSDFDLESVSLFSAGIGLSFDGPRTLFNEIVPVDEATMVVGVPIPLEIPVLWDLGSVADVDFGDGPIEFLPRKAMLAFSDGELVLLLDGSVREIVFGLYQSTDTRFLVVISSSTGSLESVVEVTADDSEQWQQWSFESSDSGITRAQAYRRDGRLLLSYQNEDGELRELDAYTGESVLLSRSFGVNCRLSGVAIDFASLTAFGHADGGCFSDLGVSDTLFRCGILLSSNLDERFNDEGARNDF